MSALGSIGKHLAPHLTGIAPDLTTSFVREALHRAIHGVGPCHQPRRLPTRSCRSSAATSTSPCAR